MVEALHKALPALVIVIVIVSVLVAVFYAWYITAPIKKISKMSRRMANMDFNNFCPVERTDEIGVLANSLNSLSSNLSAALMELKEANQKLQVDIDKEKELELRRMEFFSAASHELKTPITIIKGQLQGMLCGVDSKIAGIAMEHRNPKVSEGRHRGQGGRQYMHLSLW